MTAAIRNWAGNIAYSAARLHEPGSVEELQEIVRKARKARALGSRHSFNRIADTDADLISMRRFDRVLDVDAAARTATVEGGITYGALSPHLHRHGLALANLASLPHISVVGAVSTATHGSGVGNRNLAAAVRSMRLVTANGETVRISRGDDGFEGSVVSLGALGVVAEVTLDLEPAYEVRQDVFLDLPFARLVENFDALAAAGYSVSFFTSWRGNSVDQMWVKSRADRPFEFDPAIFGIGPAEKAYHPISTMSAESCTQQLGVPGPWHERLSHFRSEFTPSAGEELQSEYFVPRSRAADALMAIRELQDDLAPLLLVCETRTVAADDLWLSHNYRQDSVGLHFTWRQDWPAVSAVLPLIEARLEPFKPRAHWGKLFTLDPDAVEASYERLPEFRRLAERLDPAAKFSNPFVERYALG